jgi:hypothetical protein
MSIHDFMAAAAAMAVAGDGDDFATKCARDAFLHQLDLVREDPWDRHALTKYMGKDWYPALWQEFESRVSGEIPRTYVSRDAFGVFLGTQVGKYECDEFEPTDGPL